MPTAPQRKDKSPRAVRPAKTAAPVRSPAADNTLFVNSLQKGFAVLKAFSREQPHLTLAQITRETGLDKSAVQRFLFTLSELGFLHKEEATKQYRLSARLLEFGYTYLYSDPLIVRAQPFLVEAHEKTLESVNLSVLDGNDNIIVSRLPSRHVVSLNVQIGIRLPLIYSAGGLAILSRLPAVERKRILTTSHYHQHTPHTVTSRAEIARAVETAEQDGFAVVHRQFFANDISLGVPVIGADGRPLGAITIAAPDTRMSVEEARRAFLSVAAEAARKTSVSMGAL
jgi:IclR family transcriptional regulator, pca regulon regulatory protein